MFLIGYEIKICFRWWTPSDLYARLVNLLSRISSLTFLFYQIISDGSLKFNYPQNLCEKICRLERVQGSCSVSIVVMAYISLFNDLQLALNLAKIIRFQQSSKILNNVLYVIVFFAFISFAKSNISHALFNNWRRWLFHTKIKIIWKLIQNISRIKPRYIYRRFIQDLMFQSF